MSCSSGSAARPSLPSELEWVSCVACGRSYESELLLSNCGHIYCLQCKDQGRQHCTLCNRSAIKFMPITADIKRNPQVGHLFCNVNQTLKSILDVIVFQDMHKRAHIRKMNSMRRGVPQHSQQTLQQKLMERRQQTIATLKEAEQLVREMRALGLQNGDMLCYPNSSGDKVNGMNILQMSVKLINATKPGSDLHKVAALLKQSPSIRQSKNYCNTPSSKTVPTNTPQLAAMRSTPVSMMSTSSLQPTPTHTAKTGAQPTPTPVSTKTPSSQHGTKSYFTAKGSAARSVPPKVVTPRAASRGQSPMVTPQSKRAAHHLHTPTNSVMAHQFGLSSFSGSVRRPLPQQRGSMPPPPPPPTLPLLTGAHPNSSWSTPMSVSSASPKDLYSHNRRLPSSHITPSPRVYHTPQSLQQHSGGSQRSSVRRSAEAPGPYLTPSGSSSRKRTLVTPDSGRLSLRARPAGGRLVRTGTDYQSPSPMTQGTTPSSTARLPNSARMDVC